MKKSILPFLGIVMLALGAVAQDKLELTAQMPELTDGDVVFLWNSIDKVSDSTYVKNKSFSFSKKMNGGGSSFILQAGNDPEKTGLGMVIYLEPGKMHIQGNGGGFKTAKYSGDAFVSDWVALEKAMDETYKDVNNLEALQGEITQAMQVGDDAVIKANTPKAEQLSLKIREAGKQWMDAHLSSGVSAYLLNAVLGPLLPKNETMDYLTKFKGKAKENQLTVFTLSAFTGTNAEWVDKPAPDFSQPNKDGKMASLADFKGKYVLVDFWASWCSPCRQEIPELKAVYEKFKDKNFTIVSISLDKEKDKWLAAMTEENMPWLQVSDLKGDLNDAVKAYKVRGIPAKFLIDPNGKIIGAGFRNLAKEDKKLEDFLSKILTK